MYRSTDTFDHARHVTAHGESLSCALCHRDRQAARTRAGSKACASCHQPTPPHRTRVRVTREAAPGLAPGYEKAMHGLCLGCHRQEERDIAVADQYLSRCASCHRNEFASDAEMRRRAPFAVVAAAAGSAEGDVAGGAPDPGGTTGGSP
jgi:hypothetical protein